MLKGFADLFTESINEYSKKFMPILKTFLFLFLIPMIVIGIIAILIFVSTVDIFSYTSTIAVDGGNILTNPAMQNAVFTPTLIIAMILIGLITIVFISFFYLNLMHISLSKKELKFSKAFNLSKQFFWRYIGLSILMIIFVGLLSILFIIPGIIFGIYWIFAFFVLLDERKSIMDSFRGSKQIVQKRWWRTFGITLLVGLIIGIANIILSYIPVIGQIATYLVLTPFGVIFFKNLYLDMKKNKK